MKHVHRHNVSLSLREYSLLCIFQTFLGEKKRPKQSQMTQRKNQTNFFVSYELLDFFIKSPQLHLIINVTGSVLHAPGLK